MLTPVTDTKVTSAYLVLNPAAGSAAALLEPGEDATLAVLEVADDGAESLAVAGGEGSVAVERGLPLVVVPTGTLNHFARDLGAFASGHHERCVDVGRINGRPFINNVSLGVYAELKARPRATGYRRQRRG
jgi:diacylglycerol kinase family enzyme